ncbi:MAG: hypothetical protein AUK48_08565 [Oscillatoriales cyanobacterium CG2_30_44_21]|nr:MAG: hypothetical protein AUK48_08565 [Oscillatoriales cyanobacterium CG2_30_44_21]
MLILLDLFLILFLGIFDGAFGILGLLESPKEGMAEVLKEVMRRLMQLAPSPTQKIKSKPMGILIDSKDRNLKVTKLIF